MKYTPTGGTVTLTVLTKDNSSILISVSDTGPGIPQEEQAQIFAPFYQMKRSEDQLGTGLGLSLVKELLKLYNGTITLESAVGAGSTFTIVLPVTRDAFSEQLLSVSEEPIESLSPMPQTGRTALGNQ